MGKPFAITSPSNPRIKRLLKLRKHRERRASGVFLAEGRREVERAAAAGLHIEELYECPELLGGCAVAAEAAQRFVVPAAILKKAAYRDDPEGVLAVVRSPAWSLEMAPRAGLYLIAVGTQKPGNLGAMVRTAGAAGCAAVLATGPVDAFNPNAIRASTGAVFGVPVIEADDAAIIDFCKARGIRLLAAAVGQGVAYTRADYRGHVAIVIGPEDRGLDERWLTAADQRVTIPMSAPAGSMNASGQASGGVGVGGGVDSLNAAAAAAVLLFEAVRQRPSEI